MKDNEQDEILYRLDERTARIDNHLDRIDRRMAEIEDKVDEHETRINENRSDIDTIQVAARYGGSTVLALLSALAAKVFGLIRLI